MFLSFDNFFSHKIFNNFKNIFNNLPDINLMNSNFLIN